MRHEHVVVWIDHDEAVVLSVPLGNGVDLHAQEPHRVERTDTRGVQGGEADDESFFAAVSDALPRHLVPLMIVGPDVAKYDFNRFLAQRRPAIARHVVAIESMHDRTAPALVGRSVHHFEHIDHSGVFEW